MGTLSVHTDHIVCSGRSWNQLRAVVSFTDSSLHICNFFSFFTTWVIFESLMFSLKKSSGPQPLGCKQVPVQIKLKSAFVSISLFKSL